MSQLKYDIAEFVINNRDVINGHINKELERLSPRAHVFPRWMFHDLETEYTVQLLIGFIQKNFRCINSEELLLLISPEFVNITLRQSEEEDDNAYSLHKDKRT